MPTHGSGYTLTADDFSQMTALLASGDPDAIQTLGGILASTVDGGVVQLGGEDVDAFPMHAAMTGLIVVFSALGGTMGSYITARVFASFDGIHAFYFSLLPMMLILITLFFFKRETDRAAVPAVPSTEALP